MSRTALSALRGMDVIDLMAMFAGRSLTLSEIKSATKINLASCHAILTSLTERGYLTRCTKQKRYSLGPMLVAVGGAALKSQPLISYAKDAAEALYQKIKIPILLSAIAGDEVVCILSVTDAAGNDAGMRVGQRRPLLPPIGAPFLAWAPDDVRETWIKKIESTEHPASADECRHALRLIRERGFMVTLHYTDKPEIASLMEQMAKGAYKVEEKDQLTTTLQSLGQAPTQLEDIKAGVIYDVAGIAAPIFDQAGNAIFSLVLGGFQQHMTGKEIKNYAEQLVHTCIDIMKNDRDRD